MKYLKKIESFDSHNISNRDSRYIFNLLDEFVRYNFASIYDDYSLRIYRDAKNNNNGLITVSNENPTDKIKWSDISYIISYIEVLGKNFPIINIIFLKDYDSVWDILKIEDIDELDNIDLDLEFMYLQIRVDL